MVDSAYNRNNCKSLIIGIGALIKSPKILRLVTQK